MSLDEIVTRKCWPHAIKQPLTNRVYAGVHESSLYLGKGWTAARNHFTVTQFLAQRSSNVCHSKK